MIKQLATAILFSAVSFGAAMADTFPSRPVTLVVPWPPGGTTDLHLRTLAAATEKHLGQPIIIDNKPGASGTLGPATVAATAKPDGYTVTQVPITIFRLPYMQKTSWDPTKDFTYIIHVTGYTFGVAVRSESPWKTWREFLDHAKANPGKVNYGTPGTGGSLHITMEQIAQHEGIKWNQVPFKGEAEQVAALMGSHVDAIAGGTGFWPLVEAGTFRQLVVWTKERVARFPDVPTLTETGIPIVSMSPYGIAGPKGMDPKIVQILHDAFKKGMEEPAHKEMLAKLEQPMTYMNTADYQRSVMETIAEQKQMIETLGLGAKK
jgi:tripartite-type tricarboxylate transporter receptor subunit TctC